MRVYCRLALVSASILGALGLPSESLHSQDLTQLPYNHPGLVVDLGVGLWAWPIPCDADQDGDWDLVVSCPDKPSNGVWFFENRNEAVDKNGLPVFEPAVRWSSTVHFVTPSYENDRVRVLSPGIEYPRFFKSGTKETTVLSVPPRFHKPIGKQPKGPGLRHNQWQYVDYNGDGLLDLVVGVEDWSDYGWDDAWNEKGQWINGPLHGWIYVFTNTGSQDQPVYNSPTLVESDGNRLEVYGCPTPNFLDADGDGDLDLICGEFLDKFTYFENIGNRQEPRYTRGRRLLDPRGNELAMDLQMIVPVAFDWDRDGDKDLVVGEEDGRVALLRNEGCVDGTPRFLAPVYFQQKADTLKCGALATPYSVDWDNDGDIDILSGNTAGYIEYFENMSGPGVVTPKWQRPVRLRAGDRVFRIVAGPNGSIQGPAEAKWGYTTLQVTDWDMDGLKDIVVNSILGKVVWLKNVGSMNAPRLAAPASIRVRWETEPASLKWGWMRAEDSELLTQWRTTPVVHDWNQDGLPDISMLDTEGYLAFFERTSLQEERCLLPPKRLFCDPKGNPLRLNSGAAGKSGRRKLCVVDWDSDGKKDLLLNASNAEFWKQVGQRDGKWIFENRGLLAQQNIEGHDVSPGVIDLDNDNIPDFLGGAEDGRFYYLHNPNAKAPQGK